MKLYTIFIIALLAIFAGENLYALEYSKFEFEGCPENAFCKKETGANRKKWIEQLRNFSAGKISEQKLNAFVQSEYGLPVSGWGQEEASLRPNILMWDSPCKQHRATTNKYYIAEVFRKNFIPNELKELPNIFFSRAILNDSSNQPYAMIVPRGDAPLFVKDGSLYYLREEEGIFYGLLIDRDGRFKVTKNETSTEPPKESVCTKDQVALFNRESPGPNFYQGTYCKDIWDKTTRTYKTMLLGWSCN
jgi:hypothetical protein